MGVIQFNKRIEKGLLRQSLFSSLMGMRYGVPFGYELLCRVEVP